MSDPELLLLLPEERVGVVERLEPITLGLSGAGVYAVTTSRGAYVLRVQGPQVDEGAFARHLRILLRAADAGVRPAPTLADAPSLVECYQAMRAGQLDMQSPRGRASMGLALLAEGMRPRIP